MFQLRQVIDRTFPLDNLRSHLDPFVYASETYDLRP